MKPHHEARGSVQLSIIIPARNGAAALRRTLDCLRGLVDVEIIAAASGDPEGAEQAAAGRPRLFWSCASVGAAVMNAGAAWWETQNGRREKECFALVNDPVAPLGFGMTLVNLIPQ